MIKRIWGKLVAIFTIFIMILSVLPIVISEEVNELRTTETTKEEQPQEVSNYENTMIVKGQIVDDTTFTGIPGASIVFYNDDMKFRTKTNDDGYFIIEIPAGSYGVLVSAEGYYDLHEKIEGRPDQIIKVHYHMKKVESGGTEPPPEKPPEEPEKRPPPDGPPPYEREDFDRKMEPQTIEEAFGGGDSVIIANDASDSFIAIIYGTRERPNSITILAYYDRYIGAANVFDENGNLISRNEPIIVKTLFKQTFSQIIEYNDTNSNGLFDSVKYFKDEPTIPNPEPVLKTVGLWTAWERTELIEQARNDEIVEYKFDLIARNLPYHFEGDRPEFAQRGNLDLVKFTFHIYNKKDRIVRDDIPVFSFKVETFDDENREKIIEADFDDHKSYEGSRISSKVKYDYAIGGWDFHQSNDFPRLFLDMNLALLQATENMYAEFLKHHIMQDQLRLNEKLHYMDENGLNKEMYLEHNKEKDEYELVENNEEQPEKTPSETRGAETEPSNKEPVMMPEENTLMSFKDPETVENNQIRFADDIYKLGSFSWINNVTADGKNQLIHFQIQRVGWFDRYIEGLYFHGLWVKGGFNLPKAKRIHHDPTFASEVYEMEIIPEEIKSTSEKSDGLIFSASLVLIIIVIILILFYAGISSNLDKKMRPPKLPEEPLRPKTVINKDKYEKKKAEEDEYYESYYVDWDD